MLVTVERMTQLCIITATTTVLPTDPLSPRVRSSLPDSDVPRLTQHGSLRRDELLATEDRVADCAGAADNAVQRHRQQQQQPLSSRIISRRRRCLTVATTSRHVVHRRQVAADQRTGRDPVSHRAWSRSSRPVFAAPSGYI